MVRLQEIASPEEYRDTIGSMLEEVNRVTAIVEPANSIPERRIRTDQNASLGFLSSALMRETAAFLEVLIEEKGLRFTLSVTKAWAWRPTASILDKPWLIFSHNAV